MPVQVNTTSYTHCVVRWQDNNHQYAVVDTKRAKTAVTTLKCGITTLFEGYNRERRRGEIIFLGTKKDCFTYGFDLVEDDSQLNIYSWSGPPGLREQANEVAQSIHTGTSSSLQRTISSSSTTSSITSAPKQKRKKLKNTNQDDDDELTTFDDNSMPPPSSTSKLPLSEAINNNNNKNVAHDEPSNSNNQPSGSNTQANMPSPSADVDSLLEENKSLKEKILSLQDDLMYLRETSIPLPNEEIYNYMKSICSMYEQTKDEHKKKAAELGKLLPCSSVELTLAKQPNVSATINRLVRYCLKDADLKNMPYSMLYSKYPQILDQIYEYIKHIHAPLQISRTKFSSTISQKTRHIREGDKKKDAPKSSKEKRKPKKNQINSNDKNPGGNQHNSQISSEILVEDMDSDKENS